MRIVSPLLCAVASLALAGAGLAAEPAPAGNGVPDHAMTQPAAEAPAQAAAPEQPAAAGQPAAEAQPATPSASETPAAQAPKEAEAAPAAAAPHHAAPPVARHHHKPALGPVAYDASGEAGRIHTVQRGDTLWDISEAYLGTPWVWPSIWKDNPSVPNPHWIYPGEKIWISRTSMRPVSDAEAQQMLANQPEAPAAPTEDAVTAPTETLDLPNLASVGFVSADVLSAAGTILGSPRMEPWYAQHLPVYVSLGEGHVEKGDRFEIVRAKQDVRDPETGRRLGVYVDKLGWLEITDVHPESSEAMIRASSEEIRKGDRLVPYVQPNTAVDVHSSTPPVEGQVAFFPQLRTITGGHDVVFLNRGSEQGLVVGSPLEVYRANGKARDAETGKRHMLPDEVIGKLVVVEAEPRTSVAVVTHSHEEIERGDHFRAASQQ
jgi:hypothetical protein